MDINDNPQNVKDLLKTLIGNRVFTPNYLGTISGVSLTLLEDSDIFTVGIRVRHEHNKTDEWFRFEEVEFYQGYD